MFYRDKKKKSDALKFINAAYLGLLRREPESEIVEALVKSIISGFPYHKVIESIVSSNEYRGLIQPGHAQDFDHRKRKIKFIKSNNYKKIKNLIYFIPGVNKPIGGVKVAARQCEIINSIEKSDIEAKLFCPLSDGKPINWFDYGCSFKDSDIFDISSDFVVIPELWAPYYGEIFKQAGISYAIFVQNGYYLFNDIYAHDISQLNDVLDIYKTANLILTISDDTTRCVKMTLGDDIAKVIQLIPSINTSIFFPSIKKENIISYMPRKLYQHSSWIISQLTLMKIPNWQIVAIDQMREEQVADVLSRSKIFLSFADQEGFVLPALEAALCGNIVVGYTGQAAKEYWLEPLFREVISGDLFGFLENIKIVINELSHSDILQISEYSYQIAKLKLKYSRQEELIRIAALIENLQ